MAADPEPARRLVLLRHGQTAWNALGRGQGHLDIELDDTGHEQARSAAPYLAAYLPVALWSSDLARARQTAAYVAKETGLDAVYDDRLREFDLGDRTGLTMAEFEERFPVQYAAFVAGRWEGLPGAEAYHDMAVRIRPALEEAAQILGEGETAVVISHGGTIKVGIAELLGWTEESASALQHLANCGWVVLEREARRWQLVAWNRIAPDPDFASGMEVG